MLPNLNESDALNIAEHIRVVIEQKEFSNVGSGLVTATVGPATFPDGCKSREDLETQADQALLKSEKAGKNRVAISKAGSNDGGTSFESR